MDLNKVYLKDNFSLPKIDQLIDITSEYKLLSFIDTFSRYNQIRIVPKYEENMAFIIQKFIYYYKVMPFGLKNAGMTYQ